MKKTASTLFLMAGATTLVPLQGKSQSTDQTRTSGTKSMNIVYIMCDDHAYQTVGAYDRRFVETPHIDWIADNGARFTNSFVANSLSGPSRACMLTGKHSHANGFRGNSDVFDGSQQTFPKLLQQSGYQTAMIGKWHLVSDPTGFDYWDILVGQGNYYNPDFIKNGERIKREGYVTNLVTEVAIQWLDSIRDKAKPFCLFIHHKAPHRTWMPDTCDLSLYEDVTYPMPANFYDDYEGREAAKAQKMSIRKDMDLVYDLKMADKENEIHSNARLEKWGRQLYAQMTPEQRTTWNAYYEPVVAKFKKDRPTGKALDAWKYQRYMHDYCRVITSVDRNVGRVISYLKAHGLLNNTMIVYTSDQGFYMGEHGWFDKRFMYEESFRTPLLVYLPGGKRGDVTEMVQNIDYAPTMLEWAGVSVPADMQGVSLLPLLKGERTPQWRHSLYYHYYEYPDEHAVNKHYGVRTEKHALVHFYGDVDAWELYDIEKDPMNMHNLYGLPEYETVVKELKTELQRLQIRYDDPIRFEEEVSE